MTQLHDPNFVGFGGEPVTGRVPPRLFVYGEMSPEQRGAVAHVYKLFCDVAKVTPGNFLVQNRKLSDGTRVRMERHGTQDKVIVWTEGRPEGWYLPHGFAVEVPWHPGSIYRHVYTTEPEARDEWLGGEELYREVPQMRQQLTAYSALNRPSTDVEPTQVMRTQPLVATQANQRYWDYSAHGSTLAGASPNAVPINIEHTDPESGQRVLSRTLVHWIDKNFIRDKDGGLLYTMADTPHILLSEADTIRYLPGSSNATGKYAALSSWRYAEISVSSTLVKYVFCNEKVKQEEENSIALLGRNVVEFVAPLGLAQTYGGGFVAGIGEVVDGSVLHIDGYTTNLGGSYSHSYRLWRFGTNETYDSATYAPFTVMWGLQSYVIDPAPYMVTDDDGYTDTFTTARATQTINSLLLLPGINDLEYIALVNDVFYEHDRIYRAGWSGKSLTYTSPYAAYYMLDQTYIERREARHSLSGNPRIHLEVGWLPNGLALLEGVVEGALTGHKHLDKIKTTNTLNELTDFSYVTATSQPANTSICLKYYDGGACYIGYGAHDTLTAFYEIRPEPNVADYVVGLIVNGAVHSAATAGDVRPSLLAIAATHPNTTTFTYDQELPANSGSFTYVSRHILDYDHRARFAASIKTVVTCTGAAWKHGSYWGELIVDTHPTFTVEIFFEWKWHKQLGDTVTLIEGQKLLRSETATMPAFCFLPTLRTNPYRWPFDDTFFSLAYYMPPEVTLDPWAYEHVANVCKHQGVNTNFAGADFGETTAQARASDGMYFSGQKDGQPVFHKGVVPGMLYSRTFTATYDQMWLLRRLVIDAPLNNNRPLFDPYTLWHYFPTIGAMIDVERFHVELRDGVEVQWTDEVPDGFTGLPARPTDPKDRDVKVYVI